MLSSISLLQCLCSCLHCILGLISAVVRPSGANRKASCPLSNDCRSLYRLYRLTILVGHLWIDSNSSSCSWPALGCHRGRIISWAVDCRHNFVWSLSRFLCHDCVVTLGHRILLTFVLALVALLWPGPQAIPLLVVSPSTLGFFLTFESQRRSPQHSNHGLLISHAFSQASQTS